MFIIGYINRLYEKVADWFTYPPSEKKPVLVFTRPYEIAAERAVDRIEGLILEAKRHGKSRDEIKNALYNGLLRMNKKTRWFATRELEKRGYL